MIRFAFLNEPPFCFRDEVGRVTGADVELARLVAAELRCEIGFIETEFAELLPGLNKDRWDVTTGLFVTSERKRIAVFTRPIWMLADGLLVTRGNPLQMSGYQSIAKLGARSPLFRIRFNIDMRIRPE